VFRATSRWGIEQSLKPCPFAGVVTAEQVKLALGERLDIWPGVDRAKMLGPWQTMT
jgi:hypothetical protein